MTGGRSRSRTRSPEDRSSEQGLLVSRLRERRERAGWTQADLARRGGVTRQALSAIEAGRYLPNTAVALRLAGALGCRVEELFALGDDPAPGHPVCLAGEASPGARLVLARVGDRLVGHPVDDPSAASGGLREADGILRSGTRAECWIDPGEVERTVLLLGCDPALDLVQRHLDRRRPDVRIRSVNASSGRALELLASGLAHLAGTHLVDPGGAPDLSPARRALAATGGRIHAFARWEQGLVTAPGNPLGIRGVADLFRPGLRFASRPPGTGSRRLLDLLLEREGIDPGSLLPTGTGLDSHQAVCQAVALGAADAGIAVESLARLHGLGFVPLAEVRFDLAVPSPFADHPATSALWEALAETGVRRSLAALPGYRVEGVGELVEVVPKARSR